MIVVVAAVVVAICGCHSEYMVSLLLPASVPYPRCMHLHPWCVVQACEPTVSEASVPSYQPAYLSTVLGWGWGKIGWLRGLACENLPTGGDMSGWQLPRRWGRVSSRLTYLHHTAVHRIQYRELRVE